MYCKKCKKTIQECKCVIHIDLNKVPTSDWNRLAKTAFESMDQAKRIPIQRKVASV